MSLSWCCSEALPAAREGEWLHGVDIISMQLPCEQMQAVSGKKEKNNPPICQED